MVNSFLASNGLSADAQVIGGLLTNGPTLSNRQELSWAWLVDRRNTLTLALTRGSTARLGDGSQETGDLANNTSVRQTGFSVNYAYKLSPQHTLAILGARQSSKGSQRFINQKEKGKKQKSKGQLHFSFCLLRFAFCLFDFYRFPFFISPSMYSDARQLSAIIISVGFLCVPEVNAEASVTNKFLTSHDWLNWFSTEVLASLPI